MGQTLTNGVFLPDEGERNCYAGLAANWRALDYLIGGYNVHVADAVIHVSQADRDKWDAVENKADASALTAHTGDTTIHVTAEDKAKWDTVTGKADDTSVMHKTGDETAAGIKTFSDLQIISYGTQYKGARNAYIVPEFAAGYSGLSITTLGFGQTLKIGNFVLDANNRPSLDTSKAYIQFATGENNSVNSCILEPRNSTSSSLGTSSNKWNVLNGISPGALSMPSADLSSIVDISAYITVLDGSAANTYKAPADGYISITMSNSSGIQAYINGFWGNQLVRPTAGAIRFFMPICKNMTANILVFGGSVDNARFFPCQGNI